MTYIAKPKLHHPTLGCNKIGFTRRDYEGKISTPEDLYKEDVLSTMVWLKSRKIKRLMEENQQDLGKPHTDEELMMLLQTHKHLKDLERSLLQDLGTVIVK